jgi:hypothetical protein
MKRITRNGRNRRLITKKGKVRKHERDTEVLQGLNNRTFWVSFFMPHSRRLGLFFWIIGGFYAGIPFNMLDILLLATSVANSLRSYLKSAIFWRI